MIKVRKYVAVIMTILLLCSATPIFPNAIHSTASGKQGNSTENILQFDRKLSKMASSAELAYHLLPSVSNRILPCTAVRLPLYHSMTGKIIQY